MRDIRNTIATLMIILSFGVIFSLLWKPIPIVNKDTVNTAIGFILGAGVSTVLGHLYTTNKKDKDGL